MTDPRAITPGPAGSLRRVFAAPALRALPLAASLLLIPVPGSPPARADTIETVHGTTIEGVITWEGDDKLIIETPQARLTLRKETIRTIQREGPANKHLRAGDQYLQQGRHDLAREEYRQAMEYPEGAEAATRRLTQLDQVLNAKMTARENLVRERAEALRQAGKLREAVEVVTAYIDEHGATEELQRYRGSVRTELAFWYYDHVRNADALRQIELAKEDGAPAERLHLLWAKIDLLENRWSFARQEFQLALQANPHVTEEIVALVPRSESLQLLLEEMARPEPPAVIPSLPPRPLPDSRLELRRKIAQAVYAACSEEGIDPFLVEAVIACESSFDPNAQSPVGAMGLMQLMPATAEMLDVTDPFDIQQNIGGGVRYLAKLQAMFGADQLDLVLAAYNAGPTRVLRYDKKVPPYRETREYLARVKEYYRRLRNNEIASQLPSVG